MRIMVHLSKVALLLFATHSGVYGSDIKDLNLDYQGVMDCLDAVDPAEYAVRNGMTYIREWHDFGTPDAKSRWTRIHPDKYPVALLDRMDRLPGNCRSRVQAYIQPKIQEFEYAVENNDESFETSIGKLDWVTELKLGGPNPYKTNFKSSGTEFEFTWSGRFPKGAVCWKYTITTDGDNNRSASRMDNDIEPGEALKFHDTKTRDELKKESIHYLIYDIAENKWYVTEDILKIGFPLWAVFLFLGVFGVFIAGIAVFVCWCGDCCCFKFKPAEEEPLMLDNVKIVKPDSPESPQDVKAEANKAAGEAEN